jgi:MFS family permease
MRLSDKTTVLIAASLSSFLTPFMGSAVTIALPGIGRTYGMNAVTLGWVATAYILSSAALLVPFGKLADMHGRKRVFMLGIAGYALFSFLTPFSPVAAVFIALRAAQGAGGAMIFGTGMAMLSSVFPPGERGRALGINVAAVYLGLSIGPFLGGILTQHLGWKSIFYLNGLLGFLLFLFMLHKFTVDWTGEEKKPLDKTGAFLYIAAIVSLMIGFSKLPSTIGWITLLFGLAGLTGFLFHENAASSPLLNLGLFRHNTVFTFSNLAALVNYCSTSATAFLLSLYLQIVRGFSPGRAGLVLVSQPLVMTLFSPLAGRMSDKIPSRTLASLGMAVNTAALIFLSGLKSESSVPFVVFCLCFLGFGLALFSSPNTNAVMGSVDKTAYGVAAAMLGTMRLTGQMLSMGIAMLVFSLTMGNAAVTPAVKMPFLEAMHTAFILFTCLSFFGIFASLARGKPEAAGPLGPKAVGQ